MQEATTLLVQKETGDFFYTLVLGFRHEGIEEEEEEKGNTTEWQQHQRVQNTL